MEDRQQKKNNIFIRIFIQGQESSYVWDLLNFKKEQVKHGSPLCLEYGGTHGCAISCDLHEMMAAHILIMCG